MKALLLSLEQAKTLYEQGGAAKEFALKVYTEEELTKQGRPRSWEEFCENYPIQDGECWMDEDGDICMRACVDRDIDTDKNLISSKEEAEAFLALMQLRQLRKAWIGDWMPDWEDIKQVKHCICLLDDKLYVRKHANQSFCLSFQTQEMAQDFLSCFVDLLEKTKPLYK